ncbi:MAG: 50S ribosomal protein L24 [Ruminococcus sp.]|nr:50S ribosomal protein L24 [Ruminococcus sp.]MBR3918122.1 50S ribosomal protein L24 [Clostridia bacterium]
MNIKKGDKVVVLNTRRQKDKNGKAKTVTGKVLAVIPEKEQVIVEGYNMVSKHKKPKGRTEQGGIVKTEAPIHVSNVMVVCPKCGQPTRTGHKTIEENGKSIKVRFCKREDCGAVIPTVDYTK